MDRKRIDEIKGITEVIKLQAENSDLWVVLIITQGLCGEYVFIYGTEEEAQEAYDLSCKALDGVGV
jgi:hypothetical protein